MGLLAAIAASAATAQEDTASSEQRTSAQQRATDEIVVIGKSFRSESDSAATKLNIPIAETAAQVTVYSDEFLDTIGVSSLTDAVNYVPGVTADANGFDGQFFFLARGFSVSDRNAIRINNAPLGIDFFFDDVAWDRLEYVKGSQSVAYGEISAGGYINFALKKPPADRLQGAAQIRFDTFETLRTEATVGGPLNADGSIRGILAYSQEQSNEYYDDGDSFSQGAYAALNVDLTDRLSGDLYLYHDDRSSDFNSGLPIGEDLTDPLNPVYSVVSYPEDFRASGEFTNTQTHFTFAQFRSEYEINDWLSIQGNFSLLDGVQEREDMEPGAFAYGQFVDLTPGSPTFGDVGVDAFSFDRDARTEYAELRLEGRTRFTADLELDFFVSGEYYKHERVFTLYSVDNSGVENLNVFNPVRNGVNPFATKSFLFANGSENRVASISGVGSLNIRDRFRLNLGVRYDDRRGEDDTDDPTTSEVFVNDTTSFNASAVYDIRENLHIYYSYGEGIEYLTSITCDGGTLLPENNESQEIGLKWEPTDRFLASIAFFDNSSENAPRTVICPDGSASGLTTAEVNDTSNQFGEGFEIEVIGNITDGWNLSAGYAYIDDGRRGETEFVTPKSSLTLFTTYEFLDGALQGLTLGGGLKWDVDMPAAGTIQVPVNLADVDGFDPSVDPSRTINFSDTLSQPDYLVLDAVAGYRITENVDVAVNLRNITDEEYYSSFGTVFFNYIRQPPRSVMVTLNMTF